MKEFSEPDMVYCDYDREEPPSMWELFRVFHILGIKPLGFRYDRTEHGWHLIIALPESLPKLALCALQAILGSDPRRETLNLMRALSTRWNAHKSRRWNILFKEKL